MPHHPSEEHAADNLTDKVAAHSKDAKTSDHPMHDENKGAFEQAKKSSIDPLSHGRSGGPVQPEGDLPEAKGVQQLDAEAKKLNG